MFIPFAAATVVFVTWSGASVASTTTAPPNDPEARAELAFTEQMHDGSGPLSSVACSIGADASATCYGLSADLMIVTSGRALPDGLGGYGPFAPLGYGSSATSPEDGPVVGDGTHIVGQDIQPGNYVASGVGELGCFWARLSGFSGENDDTIADDSVMQPSQVIVEIAPTDVGFSSTGCGMWTPIH